MFLNKKQRVFRIEYSLFLFNIIYYDFKCVLKKAMVLSQDKSAAS
jgi:hypothetical protein